VRCAGQNTKSLGVRAVPVSMWHHEIVCSQLVVGCRVVRIPRPQSGGRSAWCFGRSAWLFFKVGAAKRDITPKEGVPMWGYGARHAALSTGTLDPLYAAALVIQAGTNKLAIVGLDLGRSPTEAQLQIIRNRIKAEAGIEYSFIAGSHTHHGPVLELTDEVAKGKGKYDASLRYYKQMEGRHRGGHYRSQRQAGCRRRWPPARFGWNIPTAIGIRRSNPNPATADLSVMRFDDASGKPLAVVINFAAHPTTISEADREVLSRLGLAR